MFGVRVKGLCFGVMLYGLGSGVDGKFCLHAQQENSTPHMDMRLGGRGCLLGVGVEREREQGREKKRAGGRKGCACVA